MSKQTANTKKTEEVKQTKKVKQTDKVKKQIAKKVTTTRFIWAITPSAKCALRTNYAYIGIDDNCDIKTYYEKYHDLFCITDDIRCIQWPTVDPEGCFNTFLENHCIEYDDSNTELVNDKIMYKGNLFNVSYKNLSTLIKNITESIPIAYPPIQKKPKKCDPNKETKPKKQPIKKQGKTVEKVNIDNDISDEIKKIPKKSKKLIENDDDSSDIEENNSESEKVNKKTSKKPITKSKKLIENDNDSSDIEEDNSESEKVNKKSPKKPITKSKDVNNDSSDIEEDNSDEEDEDDESFDIANEITKPKSKPKVEDNKKSPKKSISEPKDIKDNSSDIENSDIENSDIEESDIEESNEQLKTPIKKKEVQKK